MSSATAPLINDFLKTYDHGSGRAAYDGRAVSSCPPSWTVRATSNSKDPDEESKIGDEYIDESVAASASGHDGLEEDIVAEQRCDSSSEDVDTTGRDQAKWNSVRRLHPTRGHEEEKTKNKNIFEEGRADNDRKIDGEGDPDTSGRSYIKKVTIRTLDPSQVQRQKQKNKNHRWAPFVLELPKRWWHLSGDTRYESGCLCIPVEAFRCVGLCKQVRPELVRGVMQFDAALASAVVRGRAAWTCEALVAGALRHHSGVDFCLKCAIARSDQHVLECPRTCELMARHAVRDYCTLRTRRERVAVQPYYALGLPVDNLSTTERGEPRRPLLGGQYTLLARVLQLRERASGRDARPPVMYGINPWRVGLALDHASTSREQSRLARHHCALLPAPTAWLRPLSFPLPVAWRDDASIPAYLYHHTLGILCGYNSHERARWIRDHCSKRGTISLKPD